MSQAESLYEAKRWWLTADEADTIVVITVIVLYGNEE